MHNISQNPIVVIWAMGHDPFMVEIQARDVDIPIIQYEYGSPLVLYHIIYPI